MLVDAVPTETPTTPTYTTSDNIALQFSEQCQQQEQMQLQDIPSLGVAAATPDHQEPQQPQQPHYMMDTNVFHEGRTEGTTPTSMFVEAVAAKTPTPTLSDQFHHLIKDFDEFMEQDIPSGSGVEPPLCMQQEHVQQQDIPPSGVELCKQQEPMQQPDIPPSGSGVATAAATPDHQEPQQPQQPWYKMDTNDFYEGNGTALQTAMISQGSDLQDASWIDDFTQRMFEDDCYCSNVMISLDEFSRKLDEDLPPPSEQWQAQVSGTAAAASIF